MNNHELNNLRTEGEPEPPKLDIRHLRLIQTLPDNVFMLKPSEPLPEPPDIAA